LRAKLGKISIKKERMKKSHAPKGHMGWVINDGG
jgi:hypothetical protein